jgi:hypothetical protein
LNYWLVPHWDINGGAMAYTLSYLIYFVLLLAFIKWKIGVQPFSGKMMPVLVVVLSLFGTQLGVVVVAHPLGLPILFVKTQSSVFSSMPH